MATTAQESNLSLLKMFNKIGFNLVELEDWNCCGSTSAHNIDSQVALAVRTKGRSSSQKLNRVLRRHAALPIASGNVPYYGRVRTETDPADFPSRRLLRCR